MSTRPLPMRVLLVACLTLPPCVQAQRADDNAVKSADDAFGNSVGTENIGLYNAVEVRGFSAVDAGNVRLDGLYFDRQADLSRLLVPSTTMHVGISAQGYLLPAPTGIADYHLTRAGDQLRVSPVAWYGPFDARFAEVEIEAPIVPGRFAIAGGISAFEDAYESGADERGWVVAVAPRWRPTNSVEIVPFYSRVTVKDSEAAPLVFVSGAHLPPEVERDHFYGQSWADNESVGTNYGAVTNIHFAQDWSVNAGVFRSQLEAQASFADLYVDTTRDGLADRSIIADRDQQFASTSGELRVSRQFAAGQRRHVLYYSLRARDQQRRYGGSDVHELGVARIGERVPLPEPQFEFGPQTRDEVQQWTHALAYRGRWSELFELTLGLQKTRYEKEVTAPDDPVPQLGKDDPWLYNAGLALYTSKRLAAYASYSTGLEEGGVAPENAANKNAAPPAIRTRQWDAGLRYAFRPSLHAVVGVFDIRKPYFGLDAGNLFGELGEQRHRGMEFSIAGELVKGVDIVVGTMLLEPRVAGEQVATGRIGKIPVGQTERLTIANVDWQLPWLPAISLDATLTSVDDRMASSDNQLAIPARSVIDLGARLRFRIGRAPATLRFFVGNITDKFGWQTDPSEVFVTNAPRRFSVTIAADFPGSGTVDRSGE